VNDRQTDVLRLQPHMIPALRAAFASAANQVEAALVKLGQGGYLSGPWLGDDASKEVAAYYTQRAMDDPDSSHQSLQQYRAELGRVHDTLQQMEADYLRNENQTADAFRLQT
jgi:hypothetical protein